MNLLHGPMGIASIVNSIRRHENNGETVTHIIISRKLELQMISEAWKYYQGDLETIGTLFEIPVAVDYNLSGNDFMVETERKIRHDA